MQFFYSDWVNPALVHLVIKIKFNEYGKYFLYIVTDIVFLELKLNFREDLYKFYILFANRQPRKTDEIYT